MRPIVLALALALSCPIAVADVLWYGGDFDGRNGMPSNHRIGAYTYDDFNIHQGGSTLTGLFGQIRSHGGAFPFNEAAFEVRQGMSAGSGGVLIAQGVVEVKTEIIGKFAGVIYEVTLSGLEIQLEAGHYWMALAPFSQLGSYFALTTSGENSIGSPIGNGNAFYHNPAEGFVFSPATEVLGPGTWDFSYGVIGTPVPEPCSGFMLLLAMITCVSAKPGRYLFRRQANLKPRSCKNETAD